jgi:hypothetical protein
MDRNAAPDVDLQLLEPLLRDWVNLVGLDAVLAIVEAHGGTRLPIALKADQNADLVRLIGAEKAAILGRHYGKERPLIPKALPALRALRNRRIRHDLQVMSVRQVALKYRLGERSVYVIQASDDGPETRADTLTLPLFD